MEKQSQHSGKPKVPLKSVDVVPFHEAKKRIASIPETMKHSLHSGNPKVPIKSVDVAQFHKQSLHSGKEKEEKMSSVDVKSVDKH